MNNLIWMMLLTLFFLAMLVMDLGVFHRRPTKSPSKKPQSGAGSGLPFPSHSVSACISGKERKSDSSFSPAMFWRSRSPWTIYFCLR